MAAPGTAEAIAGRLRLVSGLVLFAFVVTHLANHALGLISLGALESGRLWFLALWRGVPGTALLAASVVVHVANALWRIYRRRHLRMPAWEAVQILTGLVIPPLLVSHIVFTAGAHALYGADDRYARVVYGLWQGRPDLGVRQVVVLVLAWTHGCVGVHFWLRLRTWYTSVKALLFAGAILLPTLALLGFVSAGREVATLARQPGWLPQLAAETRAPGPVETAMLNALVTRLWLTMTILLGAVLLARLARQAVERRREAVRITYPGGRTVGVPPGYSILEASRLGGIPHASVCGGRGRCSTCRVRVGAGLEGLPEPSADERRVLARVGAGPNVRLACQTRPRRDITVVPLVPASAGPPDATSLPGSGREQEVAVLFADLRGFTALAERKLPYDVVFILNRYFDTVGRAIHGAGGVVNQFTGDGVMALFGVEASVPTGCRQALRAAAAMVAAVEELSRGLERELPAPLRLGIGIHAGPAVVGRMGYGEGLYLTAVGDTVNAAARLEQLTKTYECDLVISEPVAAHAGIDVAGYPRHELTVRNRAAPLTIRVIDDARRFAERLGDPVA